MSENNDNKKTLLEEEKEEKKNGETLVTKRKSIMEVNPDGSTTITDSIISSTIKNEIKLDENTKINVSEVNAELDDKKYIEAMRSKNQLAVLKDSNQMICMIPLLAAENILKKMGGSLEEDYSTFAFGIYSLEEINEIKKSMIIEPPKKPPNFTKNFDITMPPIDRISRNNNLLNNDLFKNVQDKLDFIKAEEERKKREEEERKRKLEEAKQLKLLEKEKRKDKACNKLKQIRNDNRLEILAKKFGQYRNNCEQLRLVEQRKKIETEKKVLRLKIKRDGNNPEGENPENGKGADNDEEQKKLEEEKKKKEAEEKEEEERKKKEEEERLKKEEEEKKKKEEEERLKKEEEERKKKEEEERLKEEEERKKKEEEERNKKEEEEKRINEEEERNRKEE